MSEPTPTDPAAVPAPAHVIPFAPPPWLAWSVAAVCFFAAIFFAAKSFNVRGDLLAVVELERVTRLETGTLKNSLEAERILSRGQLTHLANADRLITQLREQGDLGRLSVATLTAPATAFDSAQGSSRALILWSPDRQEGLLIATQLPALPADQDYQLWLTDPAAPDAPLNAGVIVPDPATPEIRIPFKLDHPVKEAPTARITREPKGGSPKPTGPILLK